MSLGWVTWLGWEWARNEPHLSERDLPSATGWAGCVLGHITPHCRPGGGVVALCQLRAVRQPGWVTKKCARRRLQSVPSAHSTPKNSPSRKVISGAHAHQEPVPLSLLDPQPLGTHLLCTQSFSGPAWPHCQLPAAHFHQCHRLV